jgi:hypothetical protein
MKVLTEHPLPANNFVEVKTLNVGDGFLRIAGPGNATQDDFWILAKKETGTINMFNPVDGAYITGVGDNLPVVPYKCVITPVLS